MQKILYKKMEHVIIKLKIKYYDINLPKPVLTMKISSAKKGEEDKVLKGFARLAEEDLTFIVEKDNDTGEMVIRGQGETHLDVLCKKLKAKFGFCPSHVCELLFENIHF